MIIKTRGTRCLFDINTILLHAWQPLWNYHSSKTIMINKP